MTESTYSPQPDQIDQALADLAMRAVKTLQDQMQTARQPKDRIAAANSILDRLGYGRTTRAQAEVADREIRNALEAAAKAAPGGAKRAIADSPDLPASSRTLVQDANQSPDTKQDIKHDIPTAPVYPQGQNYPPLVPVDDLDQDD